MKFKSELKIRLVTGLMVVVVLAIRSEAQTAAKPASLAVTSPAFAQGKAIPKRFTCDGQDVSPAVSWSRAPEGTKSFVLIMDDPDAPAGTWVHWVFYDLPGSATGLPEGVKAVGRPPGGGTQGRNSFGNPGYGGPCPPGGQKHRYFFRVYALDGELGLREGAERGEVDAAMAGHVLASGELMGTYARKGGG